MGQDAASKRHHCINTNVVANWVGSVDGGDHMENFRFRKNYFSWMKNIKVIPKGFI